MPDADGVCERAVETGTEVVIAFADAEYGGRGFTCHDLEGMCGVWGPTIRGSKLLD